jgi:hypothetical protein
MENANFFYGREVQKTPNAWWVTRVGTPTCSSPGMGLRSSISSSGPRGLRGSLWLRGTTHVPPVRGPTSSGPRYLEPSAVDSFSQYPVYVLDRSTKEIQGDAQ